MLVVVEEKTSTATGSFGAAAATLALQMEGRKTWIDHQRLRFETSAHNLKIILHSFPSAVVEERRKREAEGNLLAEYENRSTATADGFLGNYPFVLPPLDFQRENFERFKDKQAFAIFSEQGTGKTKVALDIVSYRYHSGMLTGAIILSSPKGVHAQWVNEQMGKHLWKDVPVHAYIWEGKKPPVWLGKKTSALQVVSGNIDMLKSPKGFALLQDFIAHHKGRCLVLVDESDSIKNLTSTRSKKLRELSRPTKQRAIMSGTPIAKDLVDEWAQFYFLDPDIIGHKYLTSFRAQYCIMGGFEGRAVIGHKNVDQLKKLTAPHIFRATKKDLGLPPKIYDEVVFDLSSTQRRMIKELRDQFFASIKQGATIAVKTGAVCLLRMQQISCGFAVDENGVLHRLDENPRLDALRTLRKSIGGPVTIWCRFKEDIGIVFGEYEKTGVLYFGETKDAERIAAKERFTSGNAQEFIATAGAAGKGIDGLQHVCRDAIYYSNTYNAIDRWQSEDRIDRMGAEGSSSYFDLIGRGSPDRGILQNLKRKKDIASLALDDIKQIMEELE